MNFRQDNDPGSVRSLLALLRPSTQTNSTPTQPSWPATQTYPSLEINPFHEATYGSPQTYSPAPTPVPSQASLQALLATLKNVNSQLPSQAYASSPYGSASGPSGYQVSSDIEHSQKRRRINRDVDPYAEEHVEQSDEEKDFEIIEPPAKKQAVQVPEPAAPVPVVDIEDAQNEFGFTPEQMQDLPFQEGKEILAVLLQRRDVMNKIEEVKEEQEKFEKQMWEKRADIIASYKTKFPTDRGPDHVDYQKVFNQRKTALNKFYSQRVLPFYDLTQKKQISRLAELGFPSLGDPSKTNEELSTGDKEKREKVLALVVEALQN